MLGRERAPPEADEAEELQRQAEAEHGGCALGGPGDLQQAGRLADAVQPLQQVEPLRRGT